jgi:acetylornithine/succinyldiaminopimelate/putrescine aminotransferase
MESMSAAVSHSHLPNRPKLLTLEEAKNLGLKDLRKMWADHINPGQLHFLGLLGFDRVLIQKAEGPYYIDQNGRKILDFFGGFGSVAFGHNHPRIVAARKKFEEENRQDICMAFMQQYAAALAHNLAAIAPGDLDMVFLGSSGSEAMEAALKICEQAQGPERATVVFAENSFHGKTKGTLAVTDGALYRQQFKTTSNTKRVPFGDLEAIRVAFESDSSIGTIVLETIQGGGGINQAPAAFWQGLRALCDKHKVLWIADEVQCGMGRSGRFFAFEHFGVVPDVTALAKALGGSKTAMAAMIARREVFMKAYGVPKTALVHAPATFGGIGEGCATSIEALNVLYDENLIENAAEQGAYLLDRLKALVTKYPALLKEARGQGLMIGIEFNDISQALPFGLKQMVALLDDKLKGSLCGFFGALMLRDKGVLVAFTEYNRNVIRLEPPLTIERAHVDAFVEAMDSILARGVTGIVKDYLALKVAG